MTSFMEFMNCWQVLPTELSNLASCSFGMMILFAESAKFLDGNFLIFSLWPVSNRFYLLICSSFYSLCVICYLWITYICTVYLLQNHSCWTTEHFMHFGTLVLFCLARKVWDYLKKKKRKNFDFICWKLGLEFLENLVWKSWNWRDPADTLCKKPCGQFTLGLREAFVGRIFKEKLYILVGTFRYDMASRKVAVY